LHRPARAIIIFHRLAQALFFEGSFFRARFPAIKGTQKAAQKSSRKVSVIVAEQVLFGKPKWPQNPCKINSFGDLSTLRIFTRQRGSNNTGNYGGIA